MDFNRGEEKEKPKKQRVQVLPPIPASLFDDFSRKTCEDPTVLDRFQEILEVEQPELVSYANYVRKEAKLSDLEYAGYISGIFIAYFSVRAMAMATLRASGMFDILGVEEVEVPE